MENGELLSGGYQKPIYRNKVLKGEIVRLDDLRLTNERFQESLHNPFVRTNLTLGRLFEMFQNPEYCIGEMTCSTLLPRKVTLDIELSHSRSRELKRGRPLLCSQACFQLHSLILSVWYRDCSWKQFGIRRVAWEVLS